MMTLYLFVNDNKWTKLVNYTTISYITKLTISFVIEAKIEVVNIYKMGSWDGFKGVLAELCQQDLFEAMRFYSFFKDNTELINDLLPIIGGRLPLDLQVLNRQIN